MCPFAAFSLIYEFHKRFQIRKLKESGSFMAEKRNGMSPPPVESPSLVAANARLRTLPSGQQAYIAEKYYGGEMPWKDGGDVM